MENDSAIVATNGWPVAAQTMARAMPVFARRRFHDRLPRQQCAGFLRVLDDRDGQAILDRAEWIEELALHVHRDVQRRQTLDAHDRRPADGAENAVVDHDNGPFGERSSEAEAAQTGMIVRSPTQRPAKRPIL